MDRQRAKAQRREKREQPRWVYVEDTDSDQKSENGTFVVHISRSMTSTCITAEAVGGR